MASDEKQPEAPSNDVPPLLDGKPKYPSLRKSISIMSSIYLGSLVVGFAIGIRSKKDYDSGTFPTGMYEPPGRMALRALAWGSLLSVCGTAALAWAAACVLDIRQLSDVDPRTREFVHPKSEAIRVLVSRLQIKTVAQRTQELYPNTKEEEERPPDASSSSKS